MTSIGMIVMQGLTVHRDSPDFEEGMTGDNDRNDSKLMVTADKIELTLKQGLSADTDRADSEVGADCWQRQV